MQKIFNLTIWDPFLILENDLLHLFVLQGPRMWYQKSSIGHFVIRIKDFLNENWEAWEMLNNAIEPGSHPQNGGGCWTGSIIKHRDSQYYYYYTAADGDFSINKKQRIFCAVSDDLNNWDTNSGTPGIEIDYRIYEQYEGSGSSSEDLRAGRWYDESWRDPWVFLYDGKYHALITARVNTQYFSEHYSKETDFRRRGCIAHACSENLETWTIKQPVYLPGNAPEFEVPQFLQLGEWFYLLFSAHPQNWVEGDNERLGLGGTFYLKSRDPFHFQNPAKPLYASRHEELYSGRILNINDQLFFIAHYHTQHRYGGLFKPLPVQVDLNGELMLLFSMR